LATSYSPVALALEQEAFQHQKTSTSRFAYFEGQNCHLRTRSGAPVCGRGAKNFLNHKTAIFRQVNIDCPHAHHDALEFPDGEIVLVTYPMEGQQATVLQLPAAAVGSKAPERAVYA
jgi:hypothetical protein